MDRAIMQRNNQRMYDAQAKTLKMKRAMDEYQMLEMNLRQMRELFADKLLGVHPSAMSDGDRERMERYNAMKEKADALYCMATTGSWPPGYVPKGDEMDATKRSW